MKTKISHLGRSTVSVILAVMMLLSTMLIGTVSTVNAATNKFTEGETIYLDLSAFTDWESGTPTPSMYAYFYYFDTGNSVGNKIAATKVTDHIYSVTVPNAYCGYIQFQRGDWNMTAKHDADTKGTNNCVKVSNWNESSSWSTYSGGSTTEKNYYVAGGKGLINGTNEWTAKQESDKMTYSDTDGYYSITYTDRATGTYQFKITDDSSAWYGYDDFTVETVENGNGCTVNKSDETYKNISVKLTQKSNVTIKFNIDGEGKKHLFVIAESALSKVADSVTLTASPETVKVGSSVTLSAVANSPASENLTYTFTKTSGGEATVTQNNDKLTVTPSAAGTYKYTVTVSADGYSPVTSTEVSFTVTAPVTYYLGGRVAQTQNNSDWTAPDSITNTSCKFVETETDGLYKYESGQTPAAWSETRNDLLQYFYVRTSLGGALYYGNAEPGDDALALTAQGQKANLAEISNTDVKNLIYINSNDTSTNATFWLDTRNNEYKLWYTTALPHTVKVADGVSATVNKETATAGETVTVTATPGSGKVLDSVTVKAADGTTVETTVSGNTATFTMPDQDVTVTGVTFRDAKTYTVKFSPNNSEYGDVSAKNGTTSIATDTKVTEGDTVTFTATANEGYTFTGWTVTVNGTSNTYTDSSLSLPITANTDVVANFGTGTLSTYYLLCGYDQNFKKDTYTPVPLYKNEAGGYYADFDAAGIKKQNYYIIFSTKEDTSGIIDSYTNNNNNKDVNVIESGENGFSFGNNYAPVSQISGDSYVKYAKVNIKSDSNVTGFTIKITDLDVDNKKITYSAEPKIKEAPKNAVNIIAKNGTQTAKFQSMGKTEITQVKDVVFDIGKYNDYTQKATAIKGNTVTVTTTVADDYNDTYYVKGFVVNGESYGIQSGPNDTGVYTLEYQIPDDVADGTNFEITPVYFLKDSENCVTFYVEGFDGAVQESWGNTIACYPYYEGLSGATDKNAFGAYPGQPLLYEGGKYYTQIPKSITLDGAEKKIVGMTLNNFALESVHGAISTIKENKQSYDYDDFVRIANNNYGNNIIYTFKYSTAKDNFGELTVSPDTIIKNDFDSPTGNGWEDLTDYNHRKVDLFGNVLTGADSEKEPLLIVSNGYFENYQGYYATEWTVYKKLDDGTYSKITQIPSSALLLRSKDDLSSSTSDDKYENSLASYAGAYETLEKAYKNTPAQITFESSIKRGFSLQGHSNGGGQDGELAERVDGRWYYSMIGEVITANIAVEYGDTATSTFTKDSFVDGTNKTTTIGAQAYFTNDAAFGKTTYKSNIDSSNYFTFTADTIATDEKGQNYVFLGWYLLSDNKYTKLTDAKAPMTGSDTFVARYVKAPKGTVTIDHRLFSAASNPTPPTTQTPGTGSGKCYVTVRVLDKTTGALIKEFAETENSVTLDGTYINSVNNYELEITLRTVTSGQDKFDKFYYLAQNKQEYVGIDPGTTTTEGNETTVTRTVDIRESFFNHNDDGTYSFKNQTGSDSIHYYSDIKETKIPYKITFNYEPRLESDAKQYVVTGYFTSDYILNHGAVLTKEFVMSVAPYEDNFFNTIKWDNANITINNDTETKTAVVNSTTSLRTVTVKALNADGTPIEAYKLNNVPEYTSTVVYGNLLKYDNLYGLTPDEKTEIAGGKEYIYLADPEYNGKKFSYWQISTSSDMTDRSAYVTKCFSKEFNYIAYNDYYIWPVYGESQSITGASTTLNFLDYSRNQSTDSEGHNKTDRVFADFALAFDSNGIQLQTYKGTNIKVGMFLEVCGDLESDSNGNVITDINYYKDKRGYSTSETDLESIKSAILAGSSTKSLTYTTEAGITRKLLNKPIDIKSLDNKNRIEYYVGYNNNDNNQKKLMRAYSYVIVGNEITLCSTCYSFVNYYNVGNMTYTVS